MSFKITDRVRWVGKIDWELRHFHGHDFSTHRASTYNAYLIRDERTALIDTVWEPHAEEFVEGLKREIDLEEIDCIVANHGEIDHSGALRELMRVIPRTPIYCSRKALDSLAGHFHADWDLEPVETGDTVNLGTTELTFIEAPMLHWPDSMFCHLSGENILFSSDAFGQHYAADPLFNDEVDQAELYQEGIKYYANILTPFSPLVGKKIEALLELGLPVDTICPSHGVIWREEPEQIIERYREWASAYSEEQIAVLYDSMWQGTARIAQAIARGVRSAGVGLRVKVANLSLADQSDLVTEVFRSRLVALGSPTVNRGMLPAVAGFLEKIRGMRFQNKKGAAFGSFGWSGEAPARIAERLEDAGFEMPANELKVRWQPGGEGLKEAFDYGRTLAGMVAADDG